MTNRCLSIDEARRFCDRFGAKQDYQLGGRHRRADFAASFALKPADRRSRAP